MMISLNRPFELTRERFLDKVHPDLSEAVEVLMLMRIPVRIKNFFSRHLSPARIFVLSFAAVILIGAILLSFSFTTTRDRLTFVDALFTATSAVCVTSLVVIDIGKNLSILGQVITILQNTSFQLLTR